jgi:ubiquinone/menaquinone biosynthesis C-methylase UbiE
MQFTGERFVPSEKGQIYYEHIHRYLLCHSLIQNKNVLDIACGEGYGSAYLATQAISVVGVDISTEAIDHARNQYNHVQNLNFQIGSCDEIPQEDSSIDVVISFETIEHHNKHEEMMLEVKRVLKSDGILILSSPNKNFFQKIPNHNNPFHIKELNYMELIELLKKHFNHVLLYGQRMITTSLIAPIKSDLSFDKNLNLYSKNSLGFDMCESPYFIAICSDEVIEIGNEFTSIYIDGYDDIYEQTQKNLIEIVKIIEEWKLIKNSFLGKLQKKWLELKRNFHDFTH